MPFRPNLPGPGPLVPFREVPETPAPTAPSVDEAFFAQPYAEQEAGSGWDSSDYPEDGDHYDYYGGSAPAVDTTFIIAPRMQAWIDFGDPSLLFTDTGRTTPVASAGDLIRGVTDKSGNSQHLTQATNPPTYQPNAYRGLSASRWDGFAMKLQGPVTNSGFGYPQPITRIAVVRSTEVAAASRVAVGGQTASDPAGPWTNSGNWSAWSGSPTLADGFQDTALHVVTHVFNGASSSIALEGIVKATGTTGSGVVTRYEVGSYNDGTQLWLGDVCEFIDFQGILDPADLAYWTNYLITRWSVLTEVEFTPDQYPYETEPEHDYYSPLYDGATDAFVAGPPVVASDAYIAALDLPDHSDQPDEDEAFDFYGACGSSLTVDGFLAPHETDAFETFEQTPGTALSAGSTIFGFLSTSAGTAVASNERYVGGASFEASVTRNGSSNAIFSRTDGYRTHNRFFQRFDVAASKIGAKLAFAWWDPANGVGPYVGVDTTGHVTILDGSGVQLVSSSLVVTAEQFFRVEILWTRKGAASAIDFDVVVAVYLDPTASVADETISAVGFDGGGAFDVSGPGVGLITFGSGQVGSFGVWIDDYAISTKAFPAPTGTAAAPGAIPSRILAAFWIEQENAYQADPDEEHHNWYAQRFDGAVEAFIAGPPAAATDEYVATIDVPDASDQPGPDDAFDYSSPFVDQPEEYIAGSTPAEDPTYAAQFYAEFDVELLWPDDEPISGPVQPWVEQAEAVVGFLTVEDEIAEAAQLDRSVGQDDDQAWLAGDPTDVAPFIDGTEAILGFLTVEDEIAEAAQLPRDLGWFPEDFEQAGDPTDIAPFLDQQEEYVAGPPASDEFISTLAASSESVAADFPERIDDTEEQSVETVQIQPEENVAGSTAADDPLYLAQLAPDLGWAPEDYPEYEPVSLDAPGSIDASVVEPFLSPVPLQVADTFTRPASTALGNTEIGNEAWREDVGDWQIVTSSAFKLTQLLSDSFNRANGDQIGSTTETGAYAYLAWLGGGFNISANQIIGATSTAAVDLGIADHYSEATFVGGTNEQLAVRLSASRTDRMALYNTGTNLQLYKVLGGSATSVATYGGARSGRMRLEVVGDEVRTYRDDTLLGTYTIVDAALRGTTNVGWIAFDASTSKLDDIAAGQAASSGQLVPVASGAGQYATVDVANTDQVESIDVIGAADHGYVVGRFVDTSNLLCAGWQTASNDVTLFKAVAGVFTQVGLFTAGFHGGRVALWIEGDNVTVYVNDVPRITYTITDAILRTGTRVGVLTSDQAAFDNLNTVPPAWAVAAAQLPPRDDEAGLYDWEGFDYAQLDAASSLDVSAYTAGPPVTGDDYIATTAVVPDASDQPAPDEAWDCWAYPVEASEWLIGFLTIEDEIAEAAQDRTAGQDDDQLWTLTDPTDAAPFVDGIEYLTGFLVPADEIAQAAQPHYGDWQDWREAEQTEDYANDSTIGVEDTTNAPDTFDLTAAAQPDPSIGQDWHLWPEWDYTADQPYASELDVAPLTFPADPDEVTQAAQPTAIGQDDDALWTLTDPTDIAPFNEQAEGFIAGPPDAFDTTIATQPDPSMGQDTELVNPPDLSQLDTGYVEQAEAYVAGPPAFAPDAETIASQPAETGIDVEGRWPEWDGTDATPFLDGAEWLIGFTVPDVEITIAAQPSRAEDTAVDNPDRIEWTEETDPASTLDVSPLVRPDDPIEVTVATQLDASVGQDDDQWWTLLDPTDVTPFIDEQEEAITGSTPADDPLYAAQTWPDVSTTEYAPEETTDYANDSALDLSALTPAPDSTDTTFAAQLDPSVGQDDDQAWIAADPTDIWPFADQLEAFEEIVTPDEGIAATQDYSDDQYDPEPEWSPESLADGAVEFIASDIEQALLPAATALCEPASEPEDEAWPIYLALPDQSGEFAATQLDIALVAALDVPAALVDEPEAWTPEVVVADGIEQVAVTAEAAVTIAAQPTFDAYDWTTFEEPVADLSTIERRPIVAKPTAQPEIVDMTALADPGVDLVALKDPGVTADALSDAAVPVVARIDEVETLDALADSEVDVP